MLSKNQFNYLIIFAGSCFISLHVSTLLVTHVSELTKTPRQEGCHEDVVVRTVKAEMKVTRIVNSLVYTRASTLCVQVCARDQTRSLSTQLRTSWPSGQSRKQEKHPMMMIHHSSHDSRKVLSGDLSLSNQYACRTGSSQKTMRNRLNPRKMFARKTPHCGWHSMPLTVTPNARRVLQ